MTDIAEQLRRVVLRDPARVSLEAKIAEAMVAMSGAGDASRTAATYVAPEHEMAAASCLVVVDNEKVVGLLTAQDLVRFAVDQLPLEHLTLRDVLGEPPITVKESSLTDLAGVLQLFEQHQLSYLPILDEQGCLAGLISCDSLLKGGNAIARPREISQDSLQPDLAARQPTEAQLHSREQRYASLIAATPVGIAHTDINGIFTYANERYCEIVGFELADVIGQHWSLGKSPEVQEQLRQEFEQSQRENRPMGIEYSIQRPDGLEVWAYGQMAIEYDAEGNVTGYLATITDIRDRKRAELLLAGQQKVLERIARAEPLTEILEALLQVTEFHLPGTQCSIFLCVDDRLQFAAAPSLSRAYCDASNGAPIGEGIGSCGTAAFRKEVVVTSDIATDPLWQNYRDLALAYGLRACWSAPILGSDQTTVTGVFGIYYRDQRVPKAQDLELLRQSANIAGIAIEQSASMQALKQLNQELEQRVAERTIALQASEERWQLALKGANDGIWDWDLQQNLKFFSSRWKAIRGFRDEEIGTSPEECLSRIHPEDYDRAMAELSAHLAGETEFFECEYRARCKDGSYIWVLDRGQVLRDEAGQAIRLIGSDSDITARKQAEMARNESERRYASLAAAAPIAIFRFDTPLHCIYVNERWCEMTGRTAESAMGYGWIEAVHPDDRVLNIDQWTQDYAEARPDTHIINGTEARHLQPDGTIAWFQVNMAQEVDDDGNVVGYVGTLTDITARKAAELALRESQAQFQHMTENVPGMIYRYILHPDGTDELTYVSSQIREIFEVEPEAAIKNAASLWEKIHPDDVSWLGDAIRASAETLQPFTSAYRLCLPEQGQRWVQNMSHAERLDNGDVVWDGIVVDITDRKQQEQERERLLKIVESTSDYIGVASAEGYILWHNQAFKKMRPDLGNPADHIHLSAAHPEWVYEIMKKEVLPAAIDQGTWSGESKILDADGNEVTVSQVLIAHKSDAGEIEYFSTIIRDIRDRKAIERQLEFTQYGLDHAADCFYCLDEEAHIKQVNQATCQRTGYTQEELLSMTLHELTPTCPKETTWGPHWEKLKRLKSYSFESVQRTKTGEIFPVEVVCNYLEFDGKAYDFELIRDITARKAAEAQKSQHLAAIEAAADGIAILQANCYVYLNNSHLALLGYAPEELLGQSWHCLYSAEVLERFEQEIWPSLERDRAWQGEVIAIRKDGSCFDQCLSLTLLDDDLLICVFSDIGDRKTAEKELILKQNYLEALLNNIPHMAWIKDEQSRFIAVNQPFAEAAGKPAETLVGKADYEFWPFELAQAYRNDDRQVLQSGQRKVLEEKLSRSDGTVRWLETTKTPFRDANGELAGTVGIAADITDRKQAKIALEEEVSRRSAVFNTSHDGIHILDRAGNLMEANTGFAQMLGYSLEELSQLNIADWNAQFSHAEIQDRFQNHPANEHSTLETLHRRKDGSVFPVEITVCSMEWNGEFAFVCIARDISERKKYEIKLQQTNDELARATRLKDEFLANMSHELRTPLNVILGWSEALRDQILGPLDEKQIKALQTVEASGSHLLRLINDILDVAKIESGKVVLEKRPADIAYICNSGLVFVKQQAIQKNIQVITKIPNQLPTLVIDERRILQVLINLLDNAVKFTPERGKITLEVRCYGQKNHSAKVSTQDVDKQDSTNEFVEIAISDTGIGISPEDVSRLFQPFVQVDSALNREYTGTGLGLALVKRITELHGGSVDLSSEVGVGSCFSIKLPYETMSVDLISDSSSEEIETNAELISSNSTNSPLILIAEDNEDNANMLVSYLEFKGYRILVAPNGAEAIELAEKYCPDLILMDIQMPKINGIEATKIIRQTDPIQNIPIVALTALAMKGDEDKILAAGANYYLSKPIKLKQLNELIPQILESTVGKPEEA